MMVAMDLDAFRGHLLQMTDLLTVETAAIIEDRPRFAHTVLVLAERGALPGERLKANYIKQLDPHWVETAKLGASKADSPVRQKSEDRSTTTAPCLLCRQHGHQETSHFEQQVDQEHFMALHLDRSPGTCSPSSGIISPRIDDYSPNGKRDENNNQASQPPLAEERQRTFSPTRRPFVAPSNLSCIEEVLTPPPSKLQSPVREKISDIDFVDQQYTSTTVPDKPWFTARETCGTESATNHSTNTSRLETKFDKNVRLIPSINGNGNQSHINYKNRESSATVCLPSSIGSEKFTKHYRNHNENHFRVNQRKLLNYGVFPSEERERYARWRATDSPPINLFESRTDKMKVSSPPLNFPTQPRPDPLINEAIRILEASCHMLDETVRNLNRHPGNQKARRSEEAFLRNRRQTMSLRYPSEINRSRPNGTVPHYHHYRYRGCDRPSGMVRPSYEDIGGLTTTTVTTKFRHEKIVETTRQQ